MARTAPIDTVPGVLPVIDPRNLYSETAAGRLSSTVADALPRIYVPNRQSNSVSVIDPATYHVVDHFKVGISPQHVVRSWDLRTLWVANNGTRGRRGSLTPIDPCNLYFTPDGRSAIVAAETRKRLGFRDPHTMALQQSLPTSSCSGVNHADFSIDGRYATFTCEFRGGGLVKIDMVDRKVLGYLRLSKHGMPQGIRIAIATKNGRPIRFEIDSRDRGRFSRPAALMTTTMIDCYRARQIPLRPRALYESG